MKRKWLNVEVELFLLSAESQSWLWAEFTLNEDTQDWSFKLLFSQSWVSWSQKMETTFLSQGWWEWRVLLFFSFLVMNKVTFLLLYWKVEHRFCICRDSQENFLLLMVNWFLKKWFFHISSLSNTWSCKEAAESSQTAVLLFYLQTRVRKSKVWSGERWRMNGWSVKFVLMFLQMLNLC